MPILLDGYTEIKILDVGDGNCISAQFLTNEVGWDLLGSYTETQMQEKYHYNNGQQQTQIVPCYRTKWVMGKRGNLSEKLTMELYAERGKSRKAADELEKLKEETKISQRTLTSEISELKYKLKSDVDTKDLAVKNCVAFRERCELMERDLSTLRKAIGELKFNEILGITKGA